MFQKRTLRRCSKRKEKSSQKQAASEREKAQRATGIEKKIVSPQSKGTWRKLFALQRKVNVQKKKTRIENISSSILNDFACEAQKQSGIIHIYSVYRDLQNWNLNCVCSCFFK